MKHAVDPLAALATKPFQTLLGQELIVRRANRQLTKVT